MKLIYPALFAKLETQEGYCVEFPDLHGCISQGDSLINAIEMGIDAASGWILDELESGETIPKASDVKDIVCGDDEFINLLVLDIDSYSEKFGNKAVRKNCTIPAWLNTIAEKQNVNFSSILQESLQEKLLLN